MARRRFGLARRSRARKRKKVWDSVVMQQADLPTATLSTGVATAGGFSSIRRYESSSDMLIRRTIADALVRCVFNDVTSGGELVIRLCLGLSIFDSMGDTNGEAINAPVTDGTGPLDDADNSRWFIRCCVDIPVTFLRNLTQGSAASPLVWNPNPEMSIIFDSVSDELRFFCHIDTKAIRKLQGLETEWQQLAIQLHDNGAGISAGTFEAFVDSWNQRQVIEFLT